MKIFGGHRTAVRHLGITVDCQRLTRGGGGGLSLLQTGDRVRIELRRDTADTLTGEPEPAERRARLQQHGGFAIPASQSP